MTKNTYSNIRYDFTKTTFYATLFDIYVINIGKIDDL